MGNRGQKITSINEPIENIIQRCREAAPVMVVDEQEYGTIEKKSDYKSVLKFCGLPELYCDCTFDNFEGNEKLKDRLKELLKTQDSLILRGNTGSGKTHLAAAIFKEKPDYSNKFISIPQLLLKIRSSFNGNGETEEEIINKYTEAPLLVLDDLGAEKITEYSITTLYLIIDRRVNECKKTIITTNLSQQEIEEALGSRIASRFAGMVNIKIAMPDYRKKRG